MAEYKVRMVKTGISNFKNIGNGEIKWVSFSDGEKNGEISSGDINGIYGQNGSGKTAIVNALEILRVVMIGSHIPYALYGDLISSENNTKFKFEFIILDSIEKYKVLYEIELGTAEKKFNNENPNTKTVVIKNEKIVYYKKTTGWTDKKEYLFNNNYYRGNDIPDFLNKSIVESNKAIKFGNDAKLGTVASMSISDYKSLFFNKMFFVTYLKELIEKEKKVEEKNNIKTLQKILSIMSHFASTNLQIIQSSQLGLVYSGNFTPVNVHIKDNNLITQGMFPLIYSGSYNMPKNYYKIVEKTVCIINKAIKAMIPNIEIKIEKEKEYVDKDGEQCVVKAYSIRKGKTISLQFESEGIKRIISLLSCIVDAYKDENYCLVVDEFDSGIFEYLLGELVSTLKENAKGQIIFTSHNLRVLEKLEPNNIIFTTTNKENRFIRFKYVGKTNNIRDLYIRAIQIGGYDEELYDSVDLESLDYALTGAGEVVNEK